MSILDFVSRAGVSLKKVSTTKGGEYTGPCPSCGGSDRFHVWPADKGGEGSYWCRCCNKGGDLVQFLKDFCGYSYKDAFATAGRGRPADYRPARYRPAADPLGGTFEPKTYEGPVETWQVKAMKFVLSTQETLLKNKPMMTWLTNRGLDEAAVRRFCLGWFQGENGQPCKYRPRASWGLSVVKNEKTGRDKMLWIPRGLVIPCIKGRDIYRIRIRRPVEDIKQESDVKYYVLPGSGMEVMGYNPDRQAFVIVESELDGMMITRHAGSLTGVVSLGSAAAKPGTSVFYHLKKSLRILVALDYDKAGKSAWKWWSQNFDQARLWPVPEGKDPGEAFEKGVDIKAWIRDGLPPVITLELNQGYKKPEGLYPMQELKLLLSTYPVTIEAAADRAKIICAPGFKNRAIIQRIHDLFYLDEEIHWYLRLMHPESIIHGGNCEVVKEAV